MSFSERLKLRRIEKRYSQDEISKLIGVKGNTVWRWENDRAKPDTETIIKIAQALNTSAAYLLGETNDPTVRNQSKLMALAQYVADENTNLKEPITAGRRNNMYIIKEGEREFCIPDNEEGRKIFLDFLQSSLKGIGLVEQQVNNGTPTVTHVEMSEIA
ncbi:MAG: helix-turn-helix transcriptional regulator [Synergistaceae bacterium]|nr:helix-turn-helix transcriptional regulator [Synergistaceae bacterium]